MAQATNSYVTFTAKGQREDLENVIYDISPTDTPFMSMGSRSDAIAVSLPLQPLRQFKKIIFAKSA